MTYDWLPALLAAIADVLGYVRDTLTHKRQDDAVAAQPLAEEIKRRIDAVVAEAMARAFPADQGPPHASQLQPQAEAIRAHIDALVADSMARALASGPAVKTTAPSVLALPAAAPQAGAQPAPSDAPNPLAPAVGASVPSDKSGP